MDGMRRSMDRLRRSIRQSFRRSKKTPSSSSSSAPGAGDSSAQPQQWHNDESAVRAGNCSFQVKYLGCTEVFESRGMHICEDALKQLRNSARKSQRAILHISGDGLRVVDATSSQLIVDQTIEKVSFCAPDRNHDRGFSYICRDGATRRWLCHGFVAVRESSPLQGERLSHAVGCAFQICLERKQKRDREVAAITTVGTVSEVASIHSAPVFQTPPRSSSSTPLNHPTTPSSSTSFVRQASSRQSATIVQRMQDPQEYKAASPPPPPTKTVVNPHMRDRPHVTPQMLQRQQSLHTFSTLNSVTPFKKNASLQTRDRPEAIGAARWRSLDVPSVQPAAAYTNGNVPTWEDGSPILDTDVLPEEPEELTNEVSRLCQQMSFDLSIMSANEPHLDNGHHFSPAAIASNGPTNVHSLPKSVSSPFPPPNQQKPYETAKEARARFSQRSAGSRVVHPPSVNGQQQPQQPSVAAHQRHNQTIDWSVEADPFNADWVNLNKNTLNSTNPFIV